MLTDEALLAEANCHGPENLDTSVFASECVSACILAKNGPVLKISEGGNSIMTRVRKNPF